MSNGITVLGEFDVKGLFPTMFPLFGKMQADLAGRLRGALAASAMASVKLPSAALALSALAAVTAQIKGAGLKFNASLYADMIASLKAQLALIGGFMGALGGAKAEVFRYDGMAAGFGPAVQGEAGAGVQGGLSTDQIHAIVLMSRYPGFLESLLKLMFR
jgi:hypothetical protein